MSTKSKTQSKVHDLSDWQKNIISTGLNWTVEKEEVFDKRGNKLPVMGTFRSDNHRYLGTVGEGYTIVQNEELFKMPSAIVKAGVKVEFAGAGEMDGGESVFVKYKLPWELDIGKVGDIVSSFLIASTRHDGRGSVITKAYLERLVCTNGMTTRQGYALQYARHTSEVGERIDEMREMLVKTNEDIQSFGALATSLSKVNLKMDDIRTIVERVYHKDDANNIYTNSRKQEKARYVLAKFEANDNDEFRIHRGTAWNLYNAFTNYVDHSQRFRPSSGENDAQARIRGTLFGAGETFKHYVLGIICDVVSKNYRVSIPEEYKVM